MRGLGEADACAVDSSCAVWPRAGGSSAAASALPGHAIVYGCSGMRPGSTRRICGRRRGISLIASRLLERDGEVGAGAAVRWLASWTSVRTIVSNSFTLASSAASRVEVRLSERRAPPAALLLLVGVFAVGGDESLCVSDVAVSWS